MKKWTALFLVLCMVLSLAGMAFAEDMPVKGELIYGSNTELSGDWAHTAIWTNNASDNMVRELLHDYEPIVYDQGGALVVNKMVVDGEIKGVLNEDKTKTFTVKIQEDLLFSDGTPITAEHYLAATLLFNHKVVKDMKSKANAANIVVGAKPYSEGEAKLVSGLRLLDKYTYSVQILADKIPYFYEMEYLKTRPLPLHMWLGEGYSVKDDGEGAYIDGDMTAEVIKPKVEAARFLSEGRVSAGPYKLVSFDQAAKQAVLEVNEHYKGNFEGQKPHIQKLIITHAVDTTQFDNLKTGGINLISSLTGGKDVNTALDLEQKGGFKTVKFERNGYGKLMFQCDFGPTQFKAVRHAIAHLLNRPEFANTFTGGFGGLVHGPYGVAMWMYKESEEELAEKLNAYSYSFEEAEKLLVADGWVLNAEGKEYTEGLRYKEVTPEQAGEYVHNVKVGDKVLMPLIVEWASTTDNPVSELLSTMLAKNPDTLKVGMDIRQQEMSFTELLNWMYRDSSVDEKYAVKTYGMYNLASNFSPIYDLSYSFTVKPEELAQGFNVNFIVNPELDKLSMDMVYGVDPSDSEGYRKLWVDFIDLWNEELPEIPLYSNIYYTIFFDQLENYQENPLWGFSKAILYANLK